MPEEDYSNYDYVDPEEYVDHQSLWVPVNMPFEPEVQEEQEPEIKGLVDDVSSFVDAEV